MVLPGRDEDNEGVATTAGKASSGWRYTRANQFRMHDDLVSVEDVVSERLRSSK